eukprot:CAMPEP_0119069058 /NCGR_PEP_ID=MMETSP1178-20130426/11538_1 /TAXON_ID=33656 /ORGANISM="unid sp, Strain CCMP2000" /LENGTH=52 /DNA_ID=CAMNT_0007050785 /DNA_START=9 /DNA_END=164 /DNA_ORIENTATION=-
MTSRALADSKTPANLLPHPAYSDSPTTAVMCLGQEQGVPLPFALRRLGGARD